MKQQTKTIILKVLGILGNVLLYLFMAIALFSVIVSILSKKDSDGTATVFGYQMRIVETPSMEKHPDTDVSGYRIKDLPVDTLIVVQTVPEDPVKAEEWYSKLQLGDVLTFKYVYANEQLTITHRIVDIDKNPSEGYTISLKGDNKGDTGVTSGSGGPLTQVIDTSKAAISQNYVLGKVVAASYPIGAFITLLKKPVGLIFIIIVPCALIIIFEVVRIVNVFGEEKKRKLLDQQQKQQEESEKQQSEIEELKRQLALLQQSQQVPQAADENAQAPQNGNGEQ